MIGRRTKLKDMSLDLELSKLDLNNLHDINVALCNDITNNAEKVRSSPLFDGHGYSELLALVPPFLGPGFRLGARWNRLGETVKTRKKREKRGENGRDTI